MAGRIRHPKQNPAVLHRQPSVNVAADLDHWSKARRNVPTRNFQRLLWNQRLLGQPRRGQVALEVVSPGLEFLLRPTREHRRQPAEDFLPLLGGELLAAGVLGEGKLERLPVVQDADDGRVLWDFDTARDFDTVNKVTAHGGSIDVGGPAIAEGVVLQTSGYPTFGGKSGNVLIAFTVDGR